MAATVEVTFGNVVLLIVIIIAAKIIIGLIIGLFLKLRVYLMLRKWANMPHKNKVILHTAKRGFTVPSISPFSLKLETYLRMAKIPYEVETSFIDMKGPYGKLPWVTYNGKNIADSHLIIQFLNKEFSIDVNKGFSSEILGVGRALRMMLEEHFIWALVSFRFAESPKKAMTSVYPMSSFLAFFLPFTPLHTRLRMDAHGIGKHSREEMYDMMKDDLKTVSAVLGDKLFVGGEMPCEDDCAVFGFVAQAAWATLDSEYEKLVKEELTNLTPYCERMKEKFWPDWDSLLHSNLRFQIRRVALRSKYRSQKDIHVLPENLPDILCCTLF